MITSLKRHDKTLKTFISSQSLTISIRLNKKRVAHKMTNVSTNFFTVNLFCPYKMLKFGLMVILPHLDTF